MALSFDQRVALVTRLTAASKESPKAYRLRVLSWILLGYLLFGAILFVAVALAAGSVGFILVSRMWVLAKFVWIPVVFAWMVVRALFVRLDPPRGRLMKQGEAPRLHALISIVRRKVGVPKLDSVLLVPELNAAVVETPRFAGIFGSRRHLLLGLPLLLTQSTEELQSTLAHELGHLSGNHGRLGAWTYRVRETWARFHSGLTREDFLSRTIRNLIERYLEHFGLVTLIQARTQEFAADQSSAEISSPATAARALAWVAISEELLQQRLWRPLWKRAMNEEQPAFSPYEELFSRRREILGPPYDALLALELARVTPTDATHPSLQERLAHLGCPQPRLTLAPISAAEDLLASSLPRILREFGASWREDFAESWRERHFELRARQERLADLEGKEASQLSNEELLDRADALVALGRETEALPIMPRQPRVARSALASRSHTAVRWCRVVTSADSHTSRPRRRRNGRWWAVPAKSPLLRCASGAWSEKRICGLIGTAITPSAWNVRRERRPF